MPCYLFTYHAYGSWMPDRPQGFVKRRQGVLKPNSTMAQHYRAAMKKTEVRFSPEVQKSSIAVLLNSREKQRFACHFVATDSTHLHLLVSWRDNRKPLHMRAIVKSSITRFLNCKHGRHKWLAEGGSKKQVKDQIHFDHLVLKYLPRHTGWKWSTERGLFR